MKARIAVGLVVVILAVAACGEPGPTEPTTLESARSAWDASGITSYRYTIDRYCFCPLVSVTVTVHDGQVTSVEADPADAGFAPGTTIEGLFAEIEAVLARPDRGEVTFEFDPERGFPTHVDADPILDAIDDEFSYTVTDFEVLSG